MARSRTEGTTERPPRFRSRVSQIFLKRHSRHPLGSRGCGCDGGDGVPDFVLGNVKRGLYFYANRKGRPVLISRRLTRRIFRAASTFAG